MNNLYYDMYIAHTGQPKRSGRYPYGSGERPFQRENRGLFRQRRAARKADAARLKAARKKIAEREKARKEAEALQKHINEKQKIITSGKASEIMAYKGELTNAEYKQIFDRLDYEKKLSQYSAAETKSAMQKMDELMSTAKTVNQWAETGINMYNTMARVYNSKSEAGKEKPLEYIQPIPQGDGKKKNK